MSGANHGERRKARSPVIALGTVAAFVTAGVGLWATPDGNLIAKLIGDPTGASRGMKKPG